MFNGLRTTLARQPCAGVVHAGRQRHSGRLTKMFDSVEMNHVVDLNPKGFGRCYVVGMRKTESSGPPAWKRYKKGIGKQAEATLETLWSRTEWLTEEHIYGMWEMHRVRREQVIEWFAKRRRQARAERKKNKGSGAVSDELYDDQETTEGSGSLGLEDMMMEEDELNAS